jgi:Mg-chelatase subunit ChlD
MAGGHAVERSRRRAKSGIGSRYNRKSADRSPIQATSLTRSDIPTSGGTVYTADISRSNPSAFLFVIDQSGSMDERLETEQSKAQFVADVLNKTLYQLVIRCTRADTVTLCVRVSLARWEEESFTPFRT